MKKGIIITVSITVLLLLVINMFRQHANGVRSEREWYIKELGFQFSARVDTTRESHIRLHQINGNFDFGKEQRVQEKLRYNGLLALFLYKNGHQIELMIDSASNYRNGDSVFVDCKNNLVRIYRHNQLLSENALLRSIKGRPF